MKTTITIERQTKELLDRLKVCPDESYNSLLKRISGDLKHGRK